MGTLGVWLRQTREVKGSTLEQVEDATRIRPRFLEALEAGDFSTFPGGEVQVRGFLRIYARYLDLSPDQVLARYDIEIHGAEAASSSAPADAGPASSTRPTTSPAPPPLRSAPLSASQPRAVNLTTLAIVGVAIIILTVTVVAGGYFIIRNAGEEASAAATVTPTTPAGPGVWPTATSISPAVTPTFLVNPEGGVTLSLEATEHVWVRVIADGTMVFSGMLAPDQPVSWSGQEMITVETGNGAGLQVTINEQLQGAMCGRAEVCSRAWGPAGEIIVP